MLSPEASAKLVAQAVSKGAKPERPKKNAQFVQISVTACGDGDGDLTRVWALDDSGGVWFLSRGYNGRIEGWERVTTKRLPIK